MTGGTNGGIHVTDITNASRTMLFNLHTQTWDKNMIQFFDIPENCLPKIVSCAEIYGTMSSGALKGVPLSGVKI